jgi:hypothetical protein
VKTQKPEPPIVIWHFNPGKDTLNSLRYALSSGIPTHVTLAVGSRASDNFGKPVTREAVELAKAMKCKVVLIRYLWPSIEYEGRDSSVLFDSKYYITEIRRLRTEAKKLGVDLVGLDTEPYYKAVVKPYFKGGRKLTNRQIQNLEDVVKTVISSEGQLDFIYPAGSVRRGHPYNILAKLGRNRISEHTYYDSKVNLKGINYPYEIFGVYINTSKQNKVHKHLPLYLVNEVFDKSHRWSGKRGLFLYSKEGNAEAVAKELLEYSRNLSTRTKKNK